MTAATGRPLWYGGGRLAAGLTLPRLRRRWDSPRSGAAGTFRGVPVHCPGTGRDLRARGASGRGRGGAHPALRPATIRPGQRMRRGQRPTPCTSRRGPCGNPELRRAADSYDRAARARYGVVPARTRQGSQLRQPRG